MEVIRVLNLPLLKQTIKTNGKLWMACTGVLLLFFLLALGMYHPDTGQGRIFRWIPEVLALFLGIHTEAAGLTEYLASCLFGFFYPVTAMIYGVIAADGLMAKQVESGAMAYYLSSPNKRGRIANTQAYFLMISYFMMFLCTMLAGIIGCALRFPGKLEIVQFLLLHIGALCLSLCLGGISFFASCISDESSRFLVLGAGIPVLFLLLRMLANIGGSLEPLKFATVFTLFQTADVLEGNLSICWKFPLLAVLGFALFRGGIYLFGKRDLPL